MKLHEDVDLRYLCRNFDGKTIVDGNILIRPTNGGKSFININLKTLEVTQNGYLSVIGNWIKNGYMDDDIGINIRKALVGHCCSLCHYTFSAYDPNCCPICGQLTKRKCD